MADGLNEAEIETLRDRLVARRSEIRALLDSGAGWRKPVELDQQSVGRLSRMDAMQQQAMSQAEERRLQAELPRIEAALKRIEEGEYGWCAGCGEAIAPGRLDVDPAAHLCIGCAS